MPSPGKATSPSLLLLDQPTLHLLGRKHALPVLAWLAEHLEGGTLTSIDYAVVRSHPSAHSIMEGLLKSSLVSRAPNKVYTITERGLALLHMVQVPFGATTRTQFTQ